jgi:hypothetical protein
MFRPFLGKQNRLPFRIGQIIRVVENMRLKLSLMSFAAVFVVMVGPLAIGEADEDARPDVSITTSPAGQDFSHNVVQAENTNQTRKLRAIITILYHMVYQHSSDQRVVDIEPRQKVTLGTYYVRENCGIDKVSVDSAYFLKQ